MIALVLFCLFHSGTSVVPLSDFIPYGESDGSSRFRFGDDGITYVGFTTSPFEFLGRTHGGAHINGNGLLSFQRAANVAQQDRPCPPMDTPIIYIYFCDADERRGSSPRLTYLETTNSAYLRKVNDVIKKSFRSHRKISINWLFVVTWSGIAAHSSDVSSSLTNTFQLILATDGSSSFVLFYYNSLQWDRNGRAKVGFDYGNASTQYLLPESCTTNVRNIASNSNINQPGKWIFQVDHDIIDPSSAKTHSSSCNAEESMNLSPKVISIMGNMPLFVEGICKETNVTVKCVFLDNTQKRPPEANGYFVGDSIVCNIPFLYTLGRLNVQIVIMEPEKHPVILNDIVFVVKEYEFSDLLTIALPTAENRLYLAAHWNPLLLSLEKVRDLDSKDSGDLMGNPPSHVVCNMSLVYIVLLEHDRKAWKQVGQLTPPLLNTGVHMSPLNVTLLSDKLLPRKGKITLRTFGIFTKYTTHSGEIIQKMIPADPLYITKLLTDFERKIDSSTSNDIYHTACKTWSSNQPDFQQNTLGCPNLLNQAHLDWRFSLEKGPHYKIMNNFAAAVYVQRVPSHSGAASQCAYDDDGRLFWWLTGGGPTFRVSPNSVAGYWRHYWEDILPYTSCCKWSNEKDNDCKQFVEKRPIKSGANYSSPKPFSALGGCHITNFDGKNLTVAGEGEYVLLKFIDDNTFFRREFQMQVRLERYENVLEDDGNYSSSVITSIVTEEIDNEYDVKVQIEIIGESDNRKLSVLVDGKVLDIYGKPNLDVDEDTVPESDSAWNFQNEFVFYHDALQVTVKSSRESVITFSSGLSLNVLLIVDENGNGMLNMVGSVSDPWFKDHVDVGGLLQEGFGNETAYDSTDRKNFVDMVGELMAKWLVSPTISLFTYPPGKTYDDFYRPNAQPLFYTDWQDGNMSDVSTTMRGICEDNVECIFDYVVTGSNQVAEATRGSLELYKELNDASNKVVRQCVTPNDAYQGLWNGTSLVEGSKLVLACETASIVDGLTVTCSYRNSQDHPVWSDAYGEKVDVTNENICVYMTRTTVATMVSQSITPKFAKTTAAVTPIPLKTTTKGQLSSTENVSPSVSTERQVIPEEIPNAAKATEESTSSIHILALVLGLLMLGVIVAVVIAEYPPLAPFKRALLCRGRSYTDASSADDGISLN